ncbi:MAG: hypothetical protein JRH20_29420 [Deltaproteobacteria bacterium]|nr:hypothetical protein [Deltaproteobacteria bacterium]
MERAFNSPVTFPETYQGKGVPPLVIKNHRPSQHGKGQVSSERLMDTHVGGGRNKPASYGSSERGGYPSMMRFGKKPAKGTAQVLELLNAVTMPVFDSYHQPTVISPTRKMVQQHVVMTIFGAAGTAAEKAQAREFFAKPENKLYPAESLVFAQRAAQSFPFDKKTVVGELGVSEATWQRLEKVMERGLRR